MKTKLKAFFGFLISKLFLLNFLIAAVVSIGIFLLVKYRVDDYVDQEEVEVGWYYNMHINDALSEIKKLGLNADVDSVFVSGVEPGTVVRQEPYPTDSCGFKVKPGRTIALKVQAFVPPGRELPKLTETSLRIVVAKLQSRGLKTRVSYVPHEDDYVISASCEGHEVKKGMKVPQGSTIHLKVGQGKPKAVEVPDLMDMTISEATLRLTNASLKLHVIECAGCITLEDSSSAIAVKQSPYGGRNSFSSAGNEVSVWFELYDSEDFE